MGRARLSGLAIEPTKLEYLAKRITFYASSELKLFELLASLCAVHTQCGQPRLSYTKPDSGSESGHQNRFGRHLTLTMQTCHRVCLVSR